MRSFWKRLKTKSPKPRVYTRLAIESLEDRRLLAIDVTNLGFEASGFADAFQLEGDLVASKVSEFSQQSDLNDDGDLNDVIVHTYDASTQEGSDVALAVTDFSLDEGLLAMLVSEQAQGGRDLNGDGDAADRVLHVHDTVTDTTTNLGLSAQRFAFDGRRIAFAVSEQLQGQQDLNGDGDAFDSVLHVYDVATGVIANLRLDAGGIMLGKNGVVFQVAEWRQGNADLNGDGDTADKIVHLHDFGAGATLNTGLASNLDLQLDGNLAAVAVSESAQGYADLNGDGDTADQVMHVYNLGTRASTNLRLASRSSFDLEGSLLAIPVSEVAQGRTDLNGDGDIGDVVLHIFDNVAGAVSNLNLAVSSEIEMEGGVLAFVVRESQQGSADLNGDGDVSDSVIHVFNGDTAVVTNLGLHSQGRFEWEADRLAFFVSERSQGGEDLNADGDAFDSIVLHVFDTRTGETTNVGLAGINRLESSGDLVAFPVSESAQGRTDLNADGDATDFSVLHVYNSRTDTVENIGFATLFFHLEGDRIVFQAMEALQGNTDFNNDGDTNDRVLHFADLSPLLPTPSVLVERLTLDLHALSLRHGIANSLTAKLGGALRMIERGDSNSQRAAVGVLQAWRHEVGAQRGKAILADDADELLADVWLIIQLIQEAITE